MASRRSDFGRQYRRRKGREKSDRRLAITRLSGYAPHRGYVDWGFEGKTLLHSLTGVRNHNLITIAVRHDSSLLFICFCLSLGGQMVKKMIESYENGMK